MSLQHALRIVVVLPALCLPAAWAQDGGGPPNSESAQETQSAPSPSDAAQAAKDALRDVEGLRDAEVDVEGGVVRVRGEAEDPSVIEQAERVVAGVTGSAVSNEVALTTDFRARLRGAWRRIGDKVERVLAYLPLLPIALAIMLLSSVLAWAVSRWRWLFARFIDNVFLQDIARRVTKIAILVGGALAALEVLDATALVGGVLGAAGVAGIAIGFAFRDLAENYISSILLSIRQPFRPRDHIVIGAHEGLVTRLTTRSTELTTFDGNVVRIPNSTVFKSEIVNYSVTPERRFTFSLGVGYDVDLTNARAVGARVLTETDGVLASPAPFVLLEKLGDSSITLAFFAWVNQRTHDFGKVRTLAMSRVEDEFDRLDIDMPEPTYNIRLMRRDTGVQGKTGPRRPSATGAAVTEAGSTAKDDTMDRLVNTNQRLGEGENLLAATGPTKE